MNKIIEIVLESLVVALLTIMLFVTAIFVDNKMTEEKNKRNHETKQFLMSQVIDE